MRAKPIGTVIPNFRHETPPKQGSVLILLYESGGIIRFPLIKRPQYLGAHSGQISLPGGKAEPNETAVEAALREGEEEIGIKAETVKVLGALSEFFVIPSNFLVTPVIGIINQKPIFKADTYEVERILHGNLQELLTAEAIRQKEILAAGRFTMLAPHFEIENEIVWGATAMMLNELRILLQENFGQ
jgi:8-oxo-dGTP pyrophosphatase MutT (NUDIX family)